MSGSLILVVGPSGAGKDTVMDYARRRLVGTGRLRFARRVITRPSAIGEDHDPVDSLAFERMLSEGAFALTWEAHGLHYGLPREIDQWLAAGMVIVANGSRNMLQASLQRYPAAQVVCISASEDVLASRLAGRQREDEAGRAARMARSRMTPPVPDHAVMLDNSGPIEVAGDRFVTLLRGALDQTRISSNQQVPQ